MQLTFLDAVDSICEQAVRHVGLWSEIVSQIKAEDSFDFELCETLQEIIASFVSDLDDHLVVCIWKETEFGMADDTSVDSLYPDSVRMDLEVELLDAVTDVAVQEART